MNLFLFPKWLDRVRPHLAFGLVAGPVYLIALGYYGLWPRTRDVGYAPEQPVPYSHALHAGELGIDCRYCHTTVEESAHAAVPPTETCMNCHKSIRSASEKLVPVMESYTSGVPVRWVRVHDLPDFVYFNHSAHVRRGIGCVSCHGRVDKMEVVEQVEMLSMGWCLSCHRNPDRYLRPVRFATKMDWAPSEDPETFGARLREKNGIDPSEDCSTCHR